MGAGELADAGALDAVLIMRVMLIGCGLLGFGFAVTAVVAGLAHGLTGLASRARRSDPYAEAFGDMSFPGSGGACHPAEGEAGGDGVTASPRPIAARCPPGAMP